MDASLPYAVLINISSNMPGTAWAFSPGGSEPSLSSRTFRGYFGPCAPGLEMARFTASVHPEDAAAAADLIADATPKGQFTTKVLRCQRVDTGNYCWCECTYSRDATREGGWALRVVDVDRMIRTEQRLRAEQRRKDQFIAMLAHELRNPMSPIRTACALVRQQRPNPEVIREIDLIDTQSTLMIRLIDDLMDNARLNFNTLRLHTSRIDLRDVCTELEQVYIRSGMSEDSPLILHLPDSPVSALGDPTRLQQALSNLVRNAVTHSPTGLAITVTLETDDRAQARISVTDRGTGIAAEQLARLFKPFEPSSDSTGQGERTLGLGLGLSLASQIMHLHAGQLTARSAGLGLGSTFTLTMPVAAEFPADQPLVSEQARNGSSPARSDSRVDRRLRILVADDHVAAADSLSLLLQAWGHECCVAYDGAEAIQTAQGFAPEVVLLDISMPGMDGCQVARAIRLQAHDKPVTIIAISGYDPAHASVVVDHSDFDAYLLKPADLQKLQSMLASIR